MHFEPASVLLAIRKCTNQTYRALWGTWRPWEFWRWSKNKFKIPKINSHLLRFCFPCRRIAPFGWTSMLEVCRLANAFHISHFFPISRNFFQFLPTFYFWFQLECTGLLDQGNNSTNWKSKSMNSFISTDKPAKLSLCSFAVLLGLPPHTLW